MPFHGLVGLFTRHREALRAQLAHGATQFGALTSGYQLALGVGAAACLAGALASGLLLRSREAVSMREPGCSATGAALDEAPVA